MLNTGHLQIEMQEVLMQAMMIAIEFYHRYSNLQREVAVHSKMGELCSSVVD